MRHMSISKRDGFTLLEILIAIVILATVLTTIYAAYTGTFRLEKQVRASDAIYTMARTSLGRMTEDIECVCRYNDSLRFVSGEFETENCMGLSFFSSSHLNFDDERSSGIAIIGYDIVKDADEDSCLLRRTDELCRGNTIKTENRGYTLCTGLQSLTYTFYDSSGTEYDSWDSESSLTAQSNRLPSIVMIKMTFVNPEDTNSPYGFMTKVSLPMGENP